MLDTIIKNLRQQDSLTEISNEDWLKFGKAFAQEQDPLKSSAFLKALAAHSGANEQQIQTVFSAPAEQQKELLAELHEAQNRATQKISEFQQRHIFKSLDLSKLTISRTDWNTLITRFNTKQKQHLTSVFFLSTLGSIQKLNPAHIIDTASKSQPPRLVKRRPEHSDPQLPVKKNRYFRHLDDDGVNPLIFESKIDNPALNAKLSDAGVRIVPSLDTTSPLKGYDYVKKTPGGHKVRAVCTIDNEFTFFKYPTPQKTKEQNGRIYLDGVEKKDILTTLPKLHFARAVPVEYTATLEPILNRSGMMRRCNALTLMGASATQVFKAHGIEITPTETRSQHWAHLIAHFLTDESNVTSTTPDMELINLVPSTSAANYNTLEAIELFIREKLVDKKTEQIHIRVVPTYSDENIIPDSLIYNLDWHENQKQCTEVFYINPQSHLRTTKSMYKSFEILRKTRTEEMEVEDPSPTGRGSSILNINYS